MLLSEAGWDVFRQTDNMRVLIVDDHPVMRQGLRTVIEQDVDMSVTAEAATGRSAVRTFATMRPNVVLLDIEIHDDDVLSTVRALRRIDTTAAVLLMATFPRDHRVAQAIQAGATACFLKTATDDEILAQIRAFAHPER